MLSYGLVLLWLAGTAVWQSRWRRVFGVVAMGATSLAVATAVWVALAGDARSALKSVEHFTRSAAGQWAQQYCSGPWYQFPYLLWIVGPLTAAAALAGAGIALSTGWMKFPDYLAIADHRAAGLLAFVTLCFVSFASFVPARPR